MPLPRPTARFTRLAACALLVLGTCFSNFAQSKTEAEAMRLLQRNCFACHNAEKHKSGLNLSTRAGALKGNDDGPVIVLKKPDKSKLIAALATDADPHMPPKKQLKSAEIELLKKWISSGAKWDAATLAKASQPREVKIGSLPADFKSVYALALTADGKKLAVGRGTNIQLFDLTSTNTTSAAEWTAHSEIVRSLAWNADGTQLASGSFRELALWGMESRPANAVTVMWKRQLDDGDRVNALRFSSNDLIFAEGPRLHIADPATGQDKTNWLAHTDTINDLALTEDGKLLATASHDKLVKVWSLEDTNNAHVVPPLGGSPSYGIPSTQMRDGSASAFPLPKEIAKLEGHSAAVNGLAFKDDGSELLTIGADKLLAVWDVKSHESFATMPDRKSPLTSVAWPPKSKTAFVVEEDGSLWSYSDFKRHTGAQSSEAARERKLKDFGDDPIHIVVASADAKKIALAGEDGIVHILDENGKERQKFEPARWTSRAAASSVEAKTSRPPTTTRRSAARTPLDTPPPKGGTTNQEPPSFVRDILPVMAKAGCMAGSCHAKASGQNGFKLSVFSYDPKGDYHEITRESRARRVFPAAPEESLILLKPTATIEHGGGERFPVGSETYELIARWIRAGMPYQLTNEPTLVRITVEPSERAYKKQSATNLIITAHYSDNSNRNVTRLADYIVNDKEIAQVNEDGAIHTGSLSGETVVVARYMGMVAASRVTIPSDKKLPEAKYASLPANNFIDDLAYDRFKKLGLFPSDLCTDEEFLRRSALDAIGRLPTLDETKSYLADTAPLKRQRWIEHILADPAYADYWANKWADLLRPNPDRVGVKSIFVLDQWLRESFRANKPYDQFTREILTAEGSNHAYGPAVVYRDKREPQDRTTAFSQLFLGTRMECAKCHHHPNEKWSQDDFYQFAAFFGPLKTKGAALSPPISAGTESIFFASGSGSVKHPVTGQEMKPRPPDAPDFKASDQGDPRAALADWLTNPKNPFFARAAVNRVWAVYFGRGFCEPVDDFRASNPIANEPLLNALAEDFTAHAYDLKQLMRTIMNSRLYQLSSTPNEYNLTDTKNFSRSYRRRLPAEVLLDAVNDVLAVTDDFNGSPPDTRAIQTWTYKVNSQFMDAFSRPNASTDAPCERDGKTSIMQSLHMMNSKQLQEKLSRPTARVHQLAASNLPPEEIIEQFYLLTYTRRPTTTELQLGLTAFNTLGRTGASPVPLGASPSAVTDPKQRQTAAEDILWALLNSPEFVFNH